MNQRLCSEQRFPSTSPLPSRGYRSGRNALERRGHALRPSLRPPHLPQVAGRRSRRPDHGRPQQPEHLRMQEVAQSRARYRNLHLSRQRPCPPVSCSPDGAFGVAPPLYLALCIQANKSGQRRSTVLLEGSSPCIVSVSTWAARSRTSPSWTRRVAASGFTRRRRRRGTPPRRSKPDCGRCSKSFGFEPKMLPISAMGRRSQRIS